MRFVGEVGFSFSLNPLETMSSQLSRQQYSIVFILLLQYLYKKNYSMNSFHFFAIEQIIFGTKMNLVTLLPFQFDEFPYLMIFFMHAEPVYNYSETKIVLSITHIIKVCFYYTVAIFAIMQPYTTQLPKTLIPFCLVRCCCGNSL